MPLIQANNITKVYLMGKQQLTVLRDVNMSIEQGEFVSITGKSGSGKSTLMNIIGCLDVPTSGSYILDGQKISNMTVDQLAHIRNRKVGFVFQMFHLLPDMTALENVALPQLYAGKSEKEANQHATKVLTMVELEDRIHHFPSELSGGEQQRVAIARALVNKPTILLADEPTGSLDSVTGKKIMDLFKQLNQEQGVTVIIITHDQELANEADRIITLHDGKIIT